MSQPVTKPQWRRAIHAIVAGADLAHLHPPSKAEGMAHVHELHGPWFRQANVVGLGAGRQLRRGKHAGPALRVFVRRKFPLDHLDPNELIPKVIDGRPLGVDGDLILDVQAVGSPRAQSLIVVNRPALPGYNVGDGSGASGTIGCVVKDRTSGALLGLSCAHVLAAAGPAAGAPIYVPSYGEAQQSGVLGQAQIGTLGSVARVGFAPADGSTNVDAATFLPADPTSLSALIATLGQRPKGLRTSVATGLSVRKVGAISGDTHGVVQTTTACVKMTLADATGVTNEAIFLDQIGVSSFTDDGDSGALVLDDSYFAVGLHFWAANGLSVCQPIQRVLDSLGCNLA
jgi:hypothetical protein